MQTPSEFIFKEAMMAFQILRHALSMIRGNFGQALRVSVGPYLILGLGYFVTALLLEAGLNRFENTPDLNLFIVSGSLLSFVTIFIRLLLFILISGWVAVSWHRFILLEKYSGMLPAISGRPMGPYILCGILCALVPVMIAVPIVFFAAFVATAFAFADAELVMTVLGLTLAVALSCVWLRIAIALPSIAVGQPITMVQAWAASSGMSGTVLAITVSMMVINGLTNLVATSISSTFPVAGFVIDLVLLWFFLMLGISILTTLYGHLVEKRPLIDQDLKVI